MPPRSCAGSGAMRSAPGATKRLRHPVTPPHADHVAADAARVSKGSALARCKALPPQNGRRNRRSRQFRFVWRSPEKPLSARYPGLADGQEAAAAASQAQREIRQ